MVPYKKKITCIGNFDILANFIGSKNARLGFFTYNPETFLDSKSESEIYLINPYN
jgi:hypothetical protein